MAEEYPHDFLFRLEEANLEKDAGDGMVAIETYQRLIEMAKRPGYYPNAHLELAYFGLGDSLRGQKKYDDAVAAYREGANQATTSPELKRRCLLEAGKTYDLMREHDKAVQQYEAVLNAGSDTVQGDQARKYMKSRVYGEVRAREVGYQGMRRKAAAQVGARRLFRGYAGEEVNSCRRCSEPGSPSLLKLDP